MPTYTATCTVTPRDIVTAQRQVDLVRIQGTQCGAFRIAALITPANARTFARGIIALADEIDGGETKPAAATTVKIGDTLRVLVDDANDASVKRGDILTVSSAPRGFYGTFDAVDPRDDEWFFDAVHVGTALEILTAGEPATAPEDPRVTLINRAVDMLPVGASGTDIVAVARFLAGE